jgi:glutamate carboxypeptidase
METIIQNYFEQNLNRYLELLRNLVKTNSFTENVSGVNQNGKILADTFSKLGFKPKFVQSTNPEYGKHLVLSRPGNRNQKIGLITHLDTVFPPEEENKNDFSWRVEGDRIYGPGTNDIKGGTVLIFMVLEALERFARQNFDDISWVILANAAEERWSKDFGDLCLAELGVDALAALVFEAGYVDKQAVSLVTARKGMAVYDIFVEGKSAHAGNGHQSGANALVQIAEIIKQIEDLTDYERDLTYNIGVLNGGTVPNRVPHQAIARGEMRTFSKDVFSEGIINLLAISKIPPIKSADGVFSCNIDINVVLENKPWPRNPQTDQLFAVWQETAETMGMIAIREERGGLSDGNQVWHTIPTLDGLGPNGRHAHCSERSEDGSKDQEYTTISSFVPKATLNSLAIINLLRTSRKSSLI